MVRCVCCTAGDSLWKPPSLYRDNHQREACVVGRWVSMKRTVTTAHVEYYFINLITLEHYLYSYSFKRRRSLSQLQAGRCWQ